MNSRVRFLFKKNLNFHVFFVIYYLDLSNFFWFLIKIIGLFMGGVLNSRNGVLCSFFPNSLYFFS